MSMFLKNSLFLMLVTISALILQCAFAEQPRYCIAEIPTPVFNTPDIDSVFGGTDGKSLRLDKNMFIREMEFIALPGTVFEIQGLYAKSGNTILKIKTNDYIYNKDFYIDSRFIRYTDKRHADRQRILLPMDSILDSMASMQGQPYLWAGNVCEGVKEMMEFYSPSGDIDSTTQRIWMLKGVDCSGLLYQATNGFTPRNTSALVSFGQGMKIFGLNPQEIAGIVRPLDLIVWAGHVIIVMDKEFAIESSQVAGVVKTALVKRLESLMQERTPVDDWNTTQGKRFVVRRWYDLSS